MQCGSRARGHGALNGQGLALQLAEGDGVCAGGQRGTCEGVEGGEGVEPEASKQSTSRKNKLRARLNPAHLPDIKVKPPGRTTPADVFSSVPLEEEDEGCEELDRLKDGLTRSCRDMDTD